jgi:hypothetical protein
MLVQLECCTSASPTPWPIFKAVPPRPAYERDRERPGKAQGRGAAHRHEMKRATANSSCPGATQSRQSFRQGRSLPIDSLGTVPAPGTAHLIRCWTARRTMSTREQAS